MVRLRPAARLDLFGRGRAGSVQRDDLGRVRYTQLTDVFQEQNGIYRFDRTEKLDVARVRAAQQRPAAIELADDAPA